MKRSAITLILIINTCLLIGQISPNDLKPLYKCLEQEDYLGVKEISENLLSTNQDENIPVMGLIRYANLFSKAVLVSEGVIEYEELKNSIKEFIGKSFMMSGHPTTTNQTQDLFKYNVLRNNNGKITSTTRSSNSDNTIIYIHEEYEYVNYFNIDDYNNKNSRCQGILKEIKINTENTGNWIIKAQFEKAKIHIMD